MRASPLWLAVDSMVLVRGTLKKEEERSPKILVDKVMALSESREKLTKSVHIRLRTQGLEEDFIKEVRQECSTGDGHCRLVIHLVTQEENEFKVRAQNVNVSADKQAIERLRKKLGTENVWLGKSAA